VVDDFGQKLLFQLLKNAVNYASKVPQKIGSGYIRGPGWLFFSALGQLQILTYH
jgi:hypothetical protein